MKQTSNSEFYSDEEKIALMAEAIKIFNGLSPLERRKVRQKNRWRYLDGTKRHNNRSPTSFVERLELRYDVLDVLS